MHDESAHPAKPGLGVASSASSRISDFVRTVKGNLRSSGHAFMSIQANAATGVQVRI